MIRVQCAINDCERPPHTKVSGLCRSHYERQRRHGDPCAGRVAPGQGGYRSVHLWINKHFPRIARCECCGRTGKRTEYAEARPGRLSRWRHDWFELCARCHKAFDGYPGTRARWGQC